MEIQTFMKETSQYTFYILLFEFLKKKGHSPQIAEQLSKIYSDNPFSFFLPEEHFKTKILQYHHHKTGPAKKPILEMICNFAFKDLICWFQDSDVAKLFDAFLKLADQSNHLYIMHLKNDPDFPFHVSIITSSPRLLKEYRHTQVTNTLHIFNE